MIAPMSSTIANVSNKTLTATGTREPRSATTPRANAMSVAIGIPHPLTPSPPALNATKISAGTIMPPSAAIAGSATARRSRSSPVTSSRLISMPTTKKNTAINKSLTTWARSWSNTYDPSSNRTVVCHNVS